MASITDSRVKPARRRVFFASLRASRTLRTRPGSPILEILRTFRNPRGEVLLCSRNYFKGNNFSLDIRLTRKPFA